MHVFFGHFSVVKELIACHGEVNLKYEKETPLTIASFVGHINIVRELIKAGANVNQIYGKETPLTAACERGHLNVVKELLEAGADINQKIGNKTLLTAACKMGYWHVGLELIQADDNVSDENIAIFTPVLERGHWDVMFIKKLRLMSIKAMETYHRQQLHVDQMFFLDISLNSL